MTMLEILNIKYTRVRDISPLSGMRKLKHLYIAGAPIKDTSPVYGIRKLRVYEDR
jgi:Leucine-rich repeat (LRR) protein